MGMKIKSNVENFRKAIQFIGINGLNVIMHFCVSSFRKSRFVGWKRKENNKNK